MPPSDLCNYPLDESAQALLIRQDERSESRVPTTPPVHEPLICLTFLLDQLNQLWEAKKS